MDGYNQYPWNQGYYQSGVIYPPQHEDFGYDNRRNFDYHYQMPQVPSYYQDWSHATPSNDFQPQQEFDPSISSSPYEEKPSTDEILALILKKMDGIEENDKTMAKSIKSLEAQCTQMGQQFTQLSQQVTQLSHHQKNVESQISQLVIAIENLQEKEDEEEEGPSEEKNEDENFITQRDQEECPLMDTSTKEQESKEASKEELKNEMSISQPLHSSICTLFDNDVSIDFILPLDSFDHKKEIEKNLGILEQKGSEWKDMFRSYVEEKLTKCMDDRFTLHESLLPFEAQRLRYNGKEDRYPWPFR
ncbi:hypothetical protein ACS0TY_004712 [Phlomoides rotata]